LFGTNGTFGAPYGALSSQKRKIWVSA